MNSESKNLRSNIPGGSVSSPCVSICQLNEEGICIGCYRSMDEIREWFLMEDDERLEVLEKCGQRSRINNPFA